VSSISKRVKQLCDAAREAIPAGDRYAGGAMAYTSALTNGRAAAPPNNSLQTQAGLVLVYAKELAPAAHAFATPRVWIGRDPGCNVCLPLSDVSRVHASVDYREGTWVLRDRGSRNGTFVDGVRVTEVGLHPSVLVRFGDGFYKFVPAGIECYARYDGEGAPVTLAERRLCGGYRMHRVEQTLRRLSMGPIGVVLAGERGSERVRCAQVLHEWRYRRGPFVAVDCAARSAGEILAFVEATGAEPGTVLLDNADGLEHADVAYLSHALSTAGRAPEASSGRGGPYRTRVSAPDLAAAPDIVVGLVDASRPASELASPKPPYVLSLPPLRERKEDLYALVRRLVRDRGHTEVAFGVGFMFGLVHHDFPGGVEELEGIVTSALESVATAGESPGVLDVRHLPEAVRDRMVSLYR
jgi:hypothetical protein